MYTLNYKGWFINGYIDKPECKVLLPDSTLWGTFKSLQSAKAAISKAAISKAREWVRVKNND
jgi:hypothetical protein